MATTASSIAPWIAPTWVLISSVATTTNTLPASPARAASMVAFSADKLVYSAISLISSTISPMSFADSERLSTLSFAPCVLCAASSATLAEHSTNCVIPQDARVLLQPMQPFGRLPPRCRRPFRTFPSSPAFSSPKPSCLPRMLSIPSRRPQPRMTSPNTSSKFSAIAFISTRCFAVASASAAA